MEKFARRGTVNEERALKRAMKMLKLAAKYIRMYGDEYPISYDNEERDGSQLARDCQLVIADLTVMAEAKDEAG
jgi:hypothetical protein